jgi:hypothetical protein
MTWQSLRDHLFQLVAGAAVLGVGTATMTNLVSDARQSEKIERLEEIAPKLDKMLEKQAEANERLGRIEGKLEVTQ